MSQVKAAVMRVVRRMGYEVVRIPKAGGAALAQAHDPVRPLATYSPWNQDAAFQAVHASIAGMTLVDLYRCYELWQLVEQSAKLEAGDLIEIGVWRGGTGALIAQRARLCGIQAQVFLCDTFTGVVKANAMDSSYQGREHADTSLGLVEELIHARMGLDQVEILEGIFPDQTGSRVQDRRFRFCHIDVDVYQSAKDIVEWIWDRTVSGGILVFDDYGFQGCDGITKLVEEQRVCQDRIIIHNLNGHAIVIKR